MKHTQFKQTLRNSNHIKNLNIDQTSLKNSKCIYSLRFILLRKINNFKHGIVNMVFEMINTLMYLIMLATLQKVW